MAQWLAAARDFSDILVTLGDTAADVVRRAMELHVWREEIRISDWKNRRGENQNTVNPSYGSGTLCGFGQRDLSTLLAVVDQSVQYNVIMVS